MSLLTDFGRVSPIPALSPCEILNCAVAMAAGGDCQHEDAKSGTVLQEINQEKSLQSSSPRLESLYPGSIQKVSVGTNLSRPPEAGKNLPAADFDERSARLWKSILYCLKPASVQPPPVRYAARSKKLPPSPPAPPPPRPLSALLPPMADRHIGRKTLVLDLDETLVHSSFKPVTRADYVLSVEIESQATDVHVLKRPWVDAFMRAAGEVFEVVLFTASLSKYADPLLDILDHNSVIAHRLFREACCPFEGNYVKDLAVLGRNLNNVVIIDNSPHSYLFHPENALPVSTFIDNPNDRELLDLLPRLHTLASSSEDVRVVLDRIASKK